MSHSIRGGGGQGRGASYRQEVKCIEVGCPPSLSKLEPAWAAALGVAYCSQGPWGRYWVRAPSWGGISLVRVRDSPPPPPSCPPGPLSYQGSIATGHTYGGADGT